jgi:predicted dehydrogenase
MFLSGGQAEEAFERSERSGVFAMEALWSRFLPANRQALRWLREGRIGKPGLLEATLGFLAPPDPQNRYRNPALGGVVSFDLTVYAYELADFFLGEESAPPQVSAVWGGTGVTLSEHVTLQYGGALASLTATFAAKPEERIVITGETGRIVIPRPHLASGAVLLGQNGEPLEEYRDEETVNGFTYELREAIACIRAGKTESPVVPHSLTLRCARLFDRIAATKPFIAL